jgi:hypothetical protein
MREIIIPVVLTLFLGPGVGQLYNREFKKGALMIILSLAAALMVSARIAKGLAAEYQLDPTTMDPAAWAALSEKMNLQGLFGSPVVILCLVLLFSLWLWSLVDAWQGARRRVLARKPAQI